MAMTALKSRDSVTHSRSCLFMRAASCPIAAGAVNDVPVCQTGNVRRCLLDLRARGYWSIALSPTAAHSLFTLDLPGPAVLVLGGESGLRPLVEQTCDLRAAIPLRGGVESLNASVAGAVAMYEIARRAGHLDRSQDRW